MHTGDYNPHAYLIKIVAGKLAEIWTTQDSLRFLQQLGVIPS